MLYGYSKSGFLPKPFARALETEITKRLQDEDEVELEEIQLMARVFCRSRAGSREFHKLLEMTILQKLDILMKEPKILHSIGYEFESSGLCSIDTLKILKKKMF